MLGVTTGGSAPLAPDISAPGFMSNEQGKSFVYGRRRRGMATLLPGRYALGPCVQVVWNAKLT